MKNLLLVLFSIINIISFSQINTCSGTYYDSGGAGGNYSNNELTTTTYCSNAGNCIQITFTSFSLESGWDYMYIYDGPNTGSPLIGSYTGTSLNGSTITSSTGCLTIVFDSDGSVVYPGWAFNVSCVSCPAPGSNHNLGTGDWNTCSGTLYDNGGSGNYSNNQDIIETYCSDNGDCIEINFTSFSLESGWDYLTLHDGAGVGAPVIGTYSGTSLQGQTITSNNGCITFHFTSDGSVTYPGWVANITCVPCPIPTCSDGIQNQGETGIDCGGPCPACPPVVQPVACTNLFYTITIPGSSVMFYDDGGPGGDPCADVAGGGNYCNCNCFTTTTICAAPGEMIYVDFHEFAMWNTLNGWDWMKIYDGPNTSGTILYDNSSTGPNNPFGDCGIGNAAMEFCSSGNCLTFEFWATSVVNRAGWEATVYSTPTYCALPLPVELIEWGGSNKGEYNLLEWTTASERNCDYFLLLKSLDGNFTENSVITKISGAGNSEEKIEYHFKDKDIEPQINYYQLVQVDFDGEYEEFSVISIDNGVKDKKLVKLINMVGQEIPLDSKGFVIEVYTDGTTKKIFKNYD